MMLNVGREECALTLLAVPEAEPHLEIGTKLRGKLSHHNNCRKTILAAL